MRSKENTCEIALLEGLDEGTKIVEEGEIAAALTVHSEKEEGKRPVLERVDKTLATKMPIPIGTLEAKRQIPTFSDIINMELPPVSYLVGDWAAEASPILISGAAKCGKSLFIYSLAYAVCTGESMLDWKTPSGGVRVTIVDGEMRLQTIQKRLKGMDNNGNETPNMQIITREYYDERELNFPDLSIASEREQLLDLINPPDNPEGSSIPWTYNDGHKADSTVDSIPPVKVVVLDNVNCLFPGGDENNAAYWHAYENLIESCKRRGIAAWIVHHNSKSNPSSPSGHSKAMRRPEVVIVLQKIGEAAGQGAHFNIKFLHTRDISETAIDCSARLDLDTRWERGDYVPLEANSASCNPPKKTPERIQAEAKAMSLADKGVPYATIQEQTGIPPATISRMRKG